MVNKKATVVIQSEGFSDKRIKLDSLATAETLTVEGDSVGAYLDRSFINDIEKELVDESKQSIGINYKPRLRYKAHKEKHGKGLILTRSEINIQYNERIMKQIKQGRGSFIEYLIAAFLSGETFTYDQLIEYINIKADTNFKVKRMSQAIHVFKKSKIGFILKRVGKNPATYAFDKRALNMTREDIYALYTKVNVLTLETACGRYPFLIEMLRESGIDIQLPKWIKDIKPSAVAAEPSAVAAEPEEKLPSGIDPLLKLLNTIDGGKFDLNININFNVSLKRDKS